MGENNELSNTEQDTSKNHYCSATKKVPYTKVEYGEVTA